MFRKILTIITLILLAIVVWNMRVQIGGALEVIFTHTNIWIILLLIPEQLFMYYSVGQIFFSYMSAKKGAKKISQWNLMRVALELNFVNHAIPSGGFSGLGYITWRLRGFGASAGQVSFMYLLRYLITIIANQAQTILAIIFLVCSGILAREAYGLVWVIAFMSVAIIVAMFVAILIASSKKRIDWFAKISTKFLNWSVKKLTFGRKKQVISHNTVHKYFLDLHEDVLTARRNKRCERWGSGVRKD